MYFLIINFFYDKLFFNKYIGENKVVRNNRFLFFNIYFILNIIVLKNNQRLVKKMKKKIEIKFVCVLYIGICFLYEIYGLLIF